MLPTDHRTREISTNPTPMVLVPWRNPESGCLNFTLVYRKADRLSLPNELGLLEDGRQNALRESQATPNR